MDPDNALVRWAERTGLRCAADRPWHLFAASLDHPEWECCPCPTHPAKHPDVVALRYSYDGDRTWVWLGQCPHCQAVVWATSPRPPNG